VLRVQYRLAPADGPLNEETFGKTPLPFVGQQILRWGGGPAHGGKELSFNGTYVSTGTVPNGSVWARNPIPRTALGTHGDYQGRGFEMPAGCAELWGSQNMSKCQKMTDGENSVPDLEIVDRVTIPAGTPAGEYVLGWRWDVSADTFSICLIYLPSFCVTRY
jgi:hypothetical protein